MTTNITIAEDDAAAELVVLLSALDSTDELTAYQESVVDSVTGSVWESLPTGYLDVVEEDAEKLSERLS